jgi:flagellar biosynthetic protein FliR
MFVVMQDILDLFYTFLWPFARVSAAILASPILSARSVSIRIRIIIAVALTAVIYPSYDWPILDPLSGGGILLLIEQILIGLFMGFILQIAFAAISAAGDFVAISMGLSFAMMADPNNGHQTPVLSQLFVIIATLIFFVTGAHLVLIELFLSSFALVPINESIYNTDFLAAFIEWTSIIFVGGVMIALPLMLTLLIKNMAMGVVSRAAPSLNVFAVGFPAAMLVGFITLVILMPSMSVGFENVWVDSFRFIRTFLGDL